MKKVLLFLGMIITIFLLAGCKLYEIPEGDIKDFVDKIDYNYAYQNTNSGKCIFDVKQTENGVFTGGNTSTSYFDKSTDAIYHYIVTDVYGDYYGDGNDQFTFHHQETLSYLIDKENYKSFRVTDDKDDKTDYDLQAIINLVKNIFYTNSDGGYHNGGLYYGDYLLANVGKYYDCFSLNDDKTELIYNVNTYHRNSDKDEILTYHKLRVNAYGMLLEANTTTKNVTKKIVLETNIKCEYNIQINKLENLETKGD